MGHLQVAEFYTKKIVRLQVDSVTAKGRRRRAETSLVLIKSLKFEIHIWIKNIESLLMSYTK